MSVSVSASAPAPVKASSKKRSRRKQQPDNDPLVEEEDVDGILDEGDNNDGPGPSPKSDRKILFEQKKIVKAKILKGEYVCKQKDFVDQGEHENWTNFRLVQDTLNNNKELPWICCALCGSIQSHHGHRSGTSALTRHIQVCSKQNALALQDEGRRVIPPAWAVDVCKQSQALCCSLDMRPPWMFKGAGLRHMMQTLVDLGAKCGRLDINALLSSPTAVTTSVKVNSQKAVEAFAVDLRQAMQEKRAAATIDGYTHKNTQVHFVTMTAQYIDATWQIVSRTLFTINTPPGVSSTAENNRELIKERMEALGLNPLLIDIIMFVTDGGLDMANAILLRLYCMAHGLNVVVRNTFSVKYASVVQAALRSAPEAFEVIQECNGWIERTRKALPNQHPILKTLKCSKTASSSHLPPLLSYTISRQQVVNVLGDKAPHINVNEELLQELILFLRPLDLAGSREDSPSINAKRHAELVEHFVVEESDSYSIKKMKRAAMQEMLIMKAVTCIAECKEIVAYLSRAGFKSRLDSTVKQECETRWNSHRDMLVSLSNNWEKVSELLKNHSEESSGASKAAASKMLTRFHAINKHLVDDIIDFLTPFEAHSRKIQGKTYPTLPYVILAQTQFLNHCSQSEDDTDLMKAVKLKALSLLQSTIEIKMEHMIAVFLWPSYKNLDQYPMTAHRTDEIYAAVRERLKEFDVAPSTPTSAPSTPVSEAAGPSRKKLRLSLTDAELYGGLKARAVEQVDEVTKYVRMTESDIGDDSDLLKWWSIQGTARFPTMAKLARQILAIPATSASSETDFSDLGEMLTPKRCTTTPANANDSLVWRSYLRSKSEPK